MSVSAWVISSRRFYFKHLLGLPALAMTYDMARGIGSGAGYTRMAPVPGRMPLRLWNIVKAAGSTHELSVRSRSTPSQIVLRYPSSGSNWPQPISSWILRSR